MAKQTGRPPEVTEYVCRRLEEDYLRDMVPGDQMPSERELAERYGVDRRTIRAALVRFEEGRTLLRLPKRRSVLTQGFSVRQVFLSGRHIGISFGGRPYSMRSPYIAEVMDGIIQRQHQMGLDLLVITRDWRWPEPHKGPATHLACPLVAGLYLFEKHPPFIRRAYGELDKPMVAVDHDATMHGIQSICFDNNHAGKLVARRLHKLGHCKVVVVSESSDKPVERQDKAWQDRHAGFVSTWEARAKQPPMEILVEDRNSKKGVLARLERLLKRPPGERPTAVCVPHAGFLEPIRKLGGKHGLRIPRELTIVGYCSLDDETEMTAVRFNGLEMGTTAAGLMEELLIRSFQETPPDPSLIPKSAGTLSLDVLGDARKRGAKPEPDMRLIRGQYTAGSTHGQAPD